jgi:sugar phosphate permease
LTSDSKPTGIRHVVLGLTVAAYAITYMDRLIMSTAVPSIQKEFGFSLETMGLILGAYNLPYALFQIPSSWLGHRFGPRRMLALIVTWWSALTAATTAAWSAGSMIAIRFLFGAGESGAFPIATQSLVRWTLPAERGFAQGVTHAGSRLGSAVTPPLVAFLIAVYGWRMPFLVFGALGITWAVIWFWYYRNTPAEHRWVNAPERALIAGQLGAGRIRRAVPWRKILSSPAMWLICLMYFCYNYNLNMYLNWFPKYLNDARGFNLQKMGLYASVPFVTGMAGDLVGGWATDAWFRRTGNLSAARRGIALLGFLIAAIAIPPAMYLSNAEASVWFSGAVMFGLELTVGVSWALTLDMGGEFAGSVSAVMNTCGNLGGTLAATATAFIVKAYGWPAAFLVVGVLSLIAAALYLVIHPDRKIVPAAA